MLNSAKKDIIRREKEFIQVYNSAKFSTSFTSKRENYGPRKRGIGKYKNCTVNLEITFYHWWYCHLSNYEKLIPWNFYYSLNTLSVQITPKFNLVGENISLDILHDLVHVKVPLTHEIKHNELCAESTW